MGESRADGGPRAAAAERTTGGRRGASRRTVLSWIVFALAALHASRAAALDPRTPITEYSLTTWSEDDGPFPFGVYAIAQDHDGYLWIGARTGLIRFDGTTFKKWSGSSPLPDDRVSAICVARDGSMWLGYGTIGGITRIHNGAVTNFGTREGLPPGNVNALVEDHDGVIWAATYSGLSRYADGRWYSVGPDEGMPAENVYSILKDSARNLWVTTSVGVFRRAAGASKFDLISSSIVASLVEDSGGTIWQTNRETGLSVLATSRPAGSVSAASKGPSSGRMIYDRAGSLWVITRGSGLWRIPHAATSGRHRTTERLTRRDGLPSNEARCLFEDRHGTVWIGTRAGLTRLQETNVKAMLDTDDALVTAVASGTDGSIWIGTSQGVRRRRAGQEKIYGTRDGLPSQSVTALHQDPFGTLWVATSQGLARFDGTRFVSLIASDRTPLAGVRSMTSDSNGVLWICDQQRGLFQWKDGRLTELKETFTAEGGAHVVYADTDDRVWVGLWKTGVAVYDHDNLAFYSVANGLPPGTVNAIHQDRHGSIWVVTTGGLGRFEHGQFTTFTRNGFPEAGLSSIVEDDAGYLWFGSRAGLLRIDPAEFDGLKTNPSMRLRYTFYGTAEGVPGTPSRPGMPNAARQGDGMLWFVTSVGLAVVDPSNLHELSTPAPVRIEDVIADGTRLAPGAGLALPPRTSRLQISYSILSLAAIGKLRFRYKLENFDADWEDAGERRQASYTNLPPGSYRFRVVSSNSKGDWNEVGDALEFSIQPAFYQTRSFQLAVVLLAALATWGLWRLHLRTVQRRFDLVLAERMRMGREIHDTLLQSLVGVALEFDDIWGQLDPSAVSLRRQVERVRKQVEHYAREARQSIWNLRSPMLETNELPAALRQFGDAAVADTGIQFNLEVHGVPRRAEPRVEQELLRVGQEALSNAVHHSGARTITLHVSYYPQSVCLQIYDDGRGFEVSRIDQDRSGHWGVTSMRERAQQIGAKFAIVSTPGGGTSIEMIAALGLQEQR